jgi:PPOX class probable F420-dependent enzyme
LIAWLTKAEGMAEIPQHVLDLFDGKLRVGYMSTARPDGHLSVVPVAVAIHEGHVRISSPSETYKIRNLRENPHIAVCVPDPADARRYVMIRGTAELSDDRDKAFLAWIARTHMDMDTYPHESDDVSRTVITIRPNRFVMAKAQGAE